MRLVHVLQQWLRGTGTRRPVTDVVPASQPLRPGAETLPWAALVSALAPSLHKRCPPTCPCGRRPVPLRVL